MNIVLLIGLYPMLNFAVFFCSGVIQKGHMHKIEKNCPPPPLSKKCQHWLNPSILPPLMTVRTHHKFWKIRYNLFSCSPIRKMLALGNLPDLLTAYIFYGQPLANYQLILNLKVLTLALYQSSCSHDWNFY